MRRSISRYVDDPEAEGKKWANWNGFTPKKKRPEPVDYVTYINSRKWKRKRWKAYRHYGGFCTLCGNPGIHVHHLTYKRLGRETMEDLRLLCGQCHTMLHEEQAEYWRKRKLARGGENST